MIKDYYTGREFNFQELHTYYFQKSPYEDKIKSTIKKIIDSGFEPDEEYGWIITRKLRYEEYDKPYGEDEDHYDYIVFLDVKGDLQLTINRRFTVNHYKKNRSFNTEKTDTKTGAFSLENALFETDFIADLYIGHDEGKDYTFMHTTWVGEATSRWERGKIGRRSSIKGEALYNILNNILHKAERHAENELQFSIACQRVNEKYEAEISTIICEIKKNYKSKKLSLSSEMESKLAKASSNDGKIRAYKSQISVIETELSKLSFFSVIRKKELRTKIKEIEEQLEKFTTVEQVRNYYTEQISALDSDEKTAISQAKQKVRAKYPLPTREDFQL